MIAFRSFVLAFVVLLPTSTTTFHIAVNHATDHLHLVPYFHQPYPHPLSLRINNIDKRGLQTRPANKKPINILHLGQFPTILLTNAPAVDNSCRLRHRGTDLLAQPLADRLVHLLCLLR
jgi:hypothetical protein